MRNYRNAAAALVLALVLLMPVYAGDGIITTDKPAPAPTPAATGIITTDAAQADEAESALTTADVAIEIARDLLQSVLILF
jgi:hypothetical protein